VTSEHPASEPPGAGGPLRASVVVPVYNPGPHLDDLVASLLQQSLPAAQFEVLFCDDGSDLTTRQRLAAAVEGHPHLRVLHLEHSGWPGRPRNAGLDAARGRYVFFCDHDDRFGAEALERLCDYADRHGSDVVVGRVVGVGRALRLGTFQRNLPRAVLGVDPLLDLLTPHKLFRTAFLRRHGIRYPEGRVRLEDHQFVMQAYFAAEVISVLADYPCYYWAVRQDRPSASAGPIDPEPYFADLRRVLDLVEERCGPGERLDRLLPHWYGLKVLERIGGTAMLDHPDEYRRALLAAVRPLVAERFPARIDAHLPFPQRLRSALLRAGRDDDLLALARVEAGLRCSAAATAVGWTEDGRLRVEVQTALVLEDGTPPVFDAAGHWRPPVPLPPDVLTSTVLDAGPDLAEDSAQVLLVDRDEAVYAQGPRCPGAVAAALVDPRTARSGRPLVERAELCAELRRAGWTRSTAVLLPAEVLGAVSRRSQQVDGRRVIVDRDGSGRLVLAVEPVERTP
jgi:glycosyltransferase involved in cell wall biosynthesis